jgi:hypothetical protein
VKACTTCGGSGPFGPSKRAKDGLKSLCRKCLADKQKAYAAKNPHVWKDWAAANADRLQARDAARYAADPEGEKARVTAYQTANPEKRDHWRAKANIKKYGITLEQKEALLHKQLGKCPICSDPLKPGRTGMQVDHDHTTGKVRGLLCHPCNIVLGDFREDVALFGRAIEYLGKGILTLTRGKRPPGAEKQGTRISNLWYNYGLTPEAFQKLLTDQGNACGVCRDPLVESDAHVDHDHKFGKKAVRGLLCRACNIGLGHAKESVLVLQGAVAYLGSFRSKSGPNAPILLMACGSRGNRKCR